MNPRTNEKFVVGLYEAILKLETTEECRKFFGDLCTNIEIDTLAQRFAVAKMLKKQHIYSDVVAATGASTATISRVNRSVNYGLGGYDVVLARLPDEEEQK